MKRAIYIIVSIALLFSSCGNWNAQQTEKRAKQQAEREAAKEAKRIAIAKEKEKQESLAIIAWGDTKFGMSKKEASAVYPFSVNKIVDYKNYTKDTYPYIEASSRYKKSLKEALDLIGNIKQVRIEFDGLNKDELYRVLILSESYSAASIIKADMQKFISQFKEKYGDDFKLYQDCEDYNLMRFDLKTYAAWYNIGDYHNEYDQLVSGDNGGKYIYIFMGEDSDFKYYYLITIGNHKYPIKSYQLSENELKQNKEKEAKAKSTINSSF